MNLDASIGLQRGTLRIDAQLSAGAGETVALVGPNGAGKTSCLHAIAGLVRLERGHVRLGMRLFDDGSVTNFVRPEDRHVGVVFQDHRLLLERTVHDNVALPLLIAGVSRSEIGRRVRTILDRVGLLDRASAYPTALSSGEQQRVGIARAVVAGPRLLVADEPTGNLDPQLAEEIMQLFAELPAAGTTVLVASHDLPLVKRLRKRVLVLDHGKLVDDFRPRGEA